MFSRSLLIPFRIDWGSIWRDTLAGKRLTLFATPHDDRCVNCARTHGWQVDIECLYTGLRYRTATPPQSLG